MDNKLDHDGLLMLTDAHCSWPLLTALLLCEDPQAATPAGPLTFRLAGSTGVVSGAASWWAVASDGRAVGHAGPHVDDVRRGYARACDAAWKLHHGHDQ